MATDINMDKGISDIVGVFTDPIIVYPGGWMDTLPDWIKPAITMERLLEGLKAHKGEQPTGTDAEAMAYMYPRTMEAPLDRDWVDIYLWLGKTVMERHNPFNKDTPWPDDLEVKPLTKDQERDLAHLKAWIYERRKGARLERDRGERRQQREETKKKREELQPALFDFQ